MMQAPLVTADHRQRGRKQEYLMGNKPSEAPELEDDRSADRSPQKGPKPDNAAARIERGENNDPNPLAPPVNIEAGS
jgi:hypothetical protein